MLTPCGNLYVFPCGLVHLHIYRMWLNAPLLLFRSILSLNIAFFLQIDDFALIFVFNPKSRIKPRIEFLGLNYLGLKK